MGLSKGRLKAWFNKKITDPLLQILRRFVFFDSLSLFYIDLLIRTSLVTHILLIDY